VIPRHPVLLALAALLLTAAPASAFDLEQVPGEYDAPVHVTAPPGDASRLLVVEQAGTIELLKDFTGAPTTYLDITEKVDAGGEQGLLSMAFASASRFYVFYTQGSGTASELVVEAYDVAAGGDAADEASADEIIRIPHPVGTNHNGGQLQMGPDGNLWISTGDGGGVNRDADGDAQDPNRLLGKILRIAPGAGGGYTIPTGNPYAGGGGAPEVWATGLRNPWRFSFDRGTGDLLVGDVGESTMEEVSHAAAPGRAPGANFGWPWFEGTHVLGSGAPPATHHAPIVTQRAADGWHAIVGGYVIRDGGLGGDAGRYVYGDTYRSELCLYDFAARASYPTGEHVELLVSFGEDAAGRVYAVSLAGQVYRLVGEAGAPEGEGETCGPLPPPAPPGTGTGTAPPPSGEPPPGETATGTGPGPAPGTSPITPALRLFAITLRRQRALRRGSVFVRAGCNVDCALRASGRLEIGGRRLALRGKRLAGPAGTRRVLRLRIGPRARRIALRALRRRAPVRTVVTVVASRPDRPPVRRTLTVRVAG
jgi:glucose/arabinose dehydrogenase